jgi:hypothetical protein
MGGTCSANEVRNEKSWLESMKGRDHSEDPGVDGRIISKLILAK